MYWLLIRGNYLPLTARREGREENKKRGIRGIEDEIDVREGRNEQKGLADNDVDTI